MDLCCFLCLWPGNLFIRTGIYLDKCGIPYRFVHGERIPQGRERKKLFWKAAIDKALEIDNTQAEAYEVLGCYRCWAEWDWEGAEKAFQQALRLNPNNAGALATYSHLLCIMGRIEEALPHMELALELDPLNPSINLFYGMVLEFNQRPDDAIAAFRTTLEIEPNHPLAGGNVAYMLYLKGQHDEALAIYRKIIAGDAELTAALEDGFEKAGYKGAARAVADLEAAWYGKPGRNVGAMGIASKYKVAGEYDLAIDWLEKAYEEHDPGMPYIGVPGNNPLRSNPRFQELLRKMNLPVDEKK